MKTTRFAYAKRNVVIGPHLMAFAHEFERLGEMIDALPKSRAKFHALAKLEDAYMWLERSFREADAGVGDD